MTFVATNVTFVATNALKRSTWKRMLHQFMTERSHSNVTFVTTDFLKRVTWMNMLHLFMQERGHSNVTYVTTAFLKRVLWNHMLNQFMEEKKLFCRASSEYCNFQKFWRSLKGSELALSEIMMTTFTIIIYDPANKI